MCKRNLSVANISITMIFILALLICAGCDPEPTLIIPVSDNTPPSVSLMLRIGDQMYVANEEREVEELFIPGAPTFWFSALATDRDGGIKNVKIHIYLYINGEYGKTIDHMVYEAENPDYALPGMRGFKSRNVSLQITEDEWRGDVAITLMAPLVYGLCHAEGVNFQNDTTKTKTIKIVMTELNPY